LYPPNSGGYSRLMTQTLPMTDLAALGGYTLTLKVAVVERVDEHGLQCEHCQEEGAEVRAQIYLTAMGEQQMLSTCMACVVPAVDSVAYLDTEQPITLEVSRDVTSRPF
jgi:hypothetical protein